MKAGRRAFVSVAGLRPVLLFPCLWLGAASAHRARSPAAQWSIRGNADFWGDKGHRRRNHHHGESQPRQSRPGQDRRQPLDHPRSGPHRSVHPELEHTLAAA
jgi:hypothetical protein